MSHKLSWVAAALVGAIAISAIRPSRADIVYNMNLQVGVGIVTGIITTDGLGSLAFGNITHHSSGNLQKIPRGPSSLSSPPLLYRV